ncbi:MAG: TadE/TadG family type IV pilus assembly protein [Chloroflexota bacterium]
MTYHSCKRMKRSEKGQGLVEFSLVAILLMILVAGIAEYGTLLNDYLNLVDASREAVRYSSSFDPFAGMEGEWEENPQFYQDTIQLTHEVLAPLTLDSEEGDDIIVSFFTVGDGIYIRYPNTTGYRWSSTQTSQFTDAMIQERLQTGAQPAGVLLVEIFYHYHQRLQLPLFTELIPDPIPVYAYAMMPLAAAKPEDTPVP